MSASHRPTQDRHHGSEGEWPNLDVSVREDLIRLGVEPIDADRWLSRRTAADYAQLSPSTIDRRVRAGVLPCAYVGRSPRFRRWWIDAMIMNGGGPIAVMLLLVLFTLLAWVIVCACGGDIDCHVHYHLFHLGAPRV